MASEPLYLRVKRDITARIDQGVWPSGTFIPSETELQERYRVSRTTVRKAVEELVAEGSVEIIHGTGTRVVLPRLRLNPAVLMSFSQLALAQGVEPGRDAETLAVEPAATEVAAALGVAAGAEVARLRRVRTANGTPMSLSVTYLPVELFRGHDPRHLLSGQSLYEQLETVYNLVVHTAEDTYGIVRADPDAAAALNVPLGEPLLLITRCGFAKRGEAIEYSRNTVHPERYRHTITLRRK